jgi:hypothetical protein
MTVVDLTAHPAFSANGHHHPPATSPQEKYASFIDEATGVIGRVVGSEKEPSGAHVFAFWAADDATTLDVGHIVVAFSEEAAVIGVVDEPRRFSDMKSFLDDYFDRRMEEGLGGELITRRPEMLVFAVRVLATKHLRDDVDSHRPAVGGPVYFATPDAIDFALGVEDFSGIAIPALMHTNGNAARDAAGTAITMPDGNVVFQRSPIWIDSDYLLGPEAGHANWTGQSGLATKTSHAVFLLSAVFQKLQAEGRSVAALMFNVKGPDLLWLDKPATPEPGDETAYDSVGSRTLRQQDLAAYEALGLEPKPFDGCFRIFAPFKAGQAPGGHGDATVQLDQMRGKLAGKLNTIRDKPSEFGPVQPILLDLGPLLGIPHKLFDFGDLDDKLSSFIYEMRDLGIQSLNQFDEKMAEIDAYFEDEPSKSDWRGHHKYTIQKAKNRFGGLHHKFGGLLSRSVVQPGDVPQVDGAFTDQELRVVDIANCKTDVQELLVTRVIERVWRMAELQTLGVDTVIIFVDELNKYAAAGSQGGLRDTLVDIAARGRHLNVVLFGAQQFRSKVDGEILGNCGTSFYGRVGDEEIVNAAYRSLSETTKQELLGLKKGRLLSRHAHFRAPLFGTFPLKPTIDGMMGQRIFNGQGETSVSHHGDGLWTVIRNIPGLPPERLPSRHEVRTACEGVDPREVEKAMQQVSSVYANGLPHLRADPWRSAQQILNRARTR